jgi:hypothetical protein
MKNVVGLVSLDVELARLQQAGQAPRPGDHVTVTAWGKPTGSVQVIDVWAVKSKHGICIKASSASSPSELPFGTLGERRVWSGYPLTAGGFELNDAALIRALRPLSEAK